MTGIELSKQCGNKAMQSEKQIEHGMIDYNTARTVNNIAGFVEGVWDDIGWDKQGIGYTYHTNGTGHADLLVRSAELRSLEAEDLRHLEQMLLDALRGSGLGKYVAIDPTYRSGENDLFIDIQLIHPVTLAREFYEFWQDLSSRGMKELGL